MKKNSGVKKVTVVLFLILFIITTTLVAGFYIAIKYLPSISKKFLERELSYSSLKVSLFISKIEGENILFSTNSGEELFSIKKIVVTFDLLKTIGGKPTINYFYLEGFSSFVIKEKDRYTLPNYLTLKSNNKKPPKFTIKHIEIKNSDFKLKEGSKKITFINDIDIFLPELDTNLTLKPKISAKIGDRYIKLDGVTSIKDNEIFVEFKLLLEEFNLGKVAFLIPNINNLKIRSAVVNSSLNIIYKTSSKKDKSFNINGSVSFKNLNLDDMLTKKEFISGASGSLVLKDWDIFNNTMVVTKIDIKKIDLSLYISKDENQTSAVLPKKNGKKSNFIFHNDSLKVDNLNLTINDKVNNEVYDIRSSLSIKNLKTDTDKDIPFIVNLKTSFIDDLNCEGTFNLKKGMLDAKKIDIDGIDTDTFGYLKKGVKELKKVKIDRYNGSAFFSKESSYFSGVINLAKCIYNTKNGDIILGNTTIDLLKYDITNNTIYLNNLNVSRLTFPITETSGLDNLKFNLLKKDVSYTIKLINNEKRYTIKDNISLEGLSGSYFSKGYNFDFGLQRVDITPNLSFYSDTKYLEGDMVVSIDGSAIYYKESPVFKIEKFRATIDKIVYPRSFISFKSLVIDSSFASITINEDKKLYLFSIFPLVSDKKGSNERELINIDSGEFLIKNLNFVDYSLKKRFGLNINNINGTIKNYPSTVYPEGTLNISGAINSANSFDISGTIGKDRGFNGYFRSNELALINISPLSENYLGYALLNGYASIDSKILLNDEKLDIVTKLKLKNSRLKNESSKLKIDIQSIISKLEDSSGVVTLDIPIKGSPNKPDIDFKKIFFDIFLDIITNSTKEFNEALTGFVKDDSYEIIYFKPGKDEIVNAKNPFSSDIIKKFTDTKKYFLIECYVDKSKDENYIKEVILKDKIELYSLSPYANEANENDTKDQLKVLEKVYKEITGEDSGIVDIELLRKKVLEKIDVPQNSWYALSYKRANSIKNLLITQYNVSEEKIGIEEKNIFENRYIDGIGNNIGVLFSGKKR